MAFINHRIYSLPEEFRADLKLVMDFVERWNKQDAEKGVAVAAENINTILKACEDDDERSNIVDNLTSADEDKLKEEHMKDYHGDKEHWEDSYETFIEDLSLEDLKKILV